MRKTIARYFRGWERLDSAALGQIFTDDAIYVVRPFGGHTYQGLDEIRQYWRDHLVKKQINPRTRVIKGAFGKSYTFVEWEAEFDTLEQTHKLLKRMMVLEFEGDKIRELREHFDTKVIEYVQIF